MIKERQERRRIRFFFNEGTVSERWRERKRSDKENKQIKMTFRDW